MTISLTRESQGRLADGITNNSRVSGLTHNFYRYPARFSPEFVRAILLEFSAPGDLVYDPFMGGGTTLVEAVALGRDALGTDISSLATFVSKAKTTTLTDKQLSNVGSWIHAVVPTLTLATESSDAEGWIKNNYQKNINGRATWRIRKLIEVGLDAVRLLNTRSERQLARCILLKTGQWALDCRSEIPTTRAFQTQVGINAAEIISAAREYATLMRRQSCKSRITCLHRSAIGIENDKRVRRAGKPRLVLTSPPYPGLHVLYHRWQVKGRRETAAPFWIAGTLDGDGSSFYTFGDRKQPGLSRYFDQVQSAFSSIHSIIDNGALVVQMVAFAEPRWQLPRYLEAMSEAGFNEQAVQISDDHSDGRMWRSVPGRKWYASQMGSTGGSQEVVLFHKKK